MLLRHRRCFWQVELHISEGNSGQDVGTTNNGVITERYEWALPMGVTSVTRVGGDGTSGHLSLPLPDTGQ